jgi:hypothetical protein
MASVWYASREQLKSALDIAETARNNTQVDRALESASRAVEGDLHRRFYPLTATRTFDWPNRSYSRPWRLWLDQHELISVTTLTAGGEVIAPGDFLLRPDDGPPFTHIELDLSSRASFTAGSTHQRAISIAGVFGHSADEAPAGALEAAVADTTGTTVDVTDSATTGVGTILRGETERMIVTGRGMLDTGQDLQVALTASHADTALTAQDGTGYTVGEVLLLDAERMLLVDIAGDNLIVRRAWDGSVLAAHSIGADIYAPRRLTVQRGALGTAATTHPDITALTRHVPPGPIVVYTLALAINTVLQETAGYARTIGSAENEQEAAGRGLRSARAEAWKTYARKARMRAV